MAQWITICFPLYGCWQEPFERLGTSLKEMIRQRELKPQQLAAVTKLFYAIERLPNPTEDIAIEASAIISHEDGRGWLSLSHYGDSMELSYWEALYELQGTEHSSSNVLRAEVGVGNDRENEDPIRVMIELEDWVAQWSNRVCSPDCEFEISDQADNNDWDQPRHPRGWEALPDGV